MTSKKKSLYGCAAFDFTPSVSDELQLQVGSVVKILKDIDEFWYSGQSLCDGKKGLFPKEYVHIIDFPDLKNGETYLFALDTFYPQVNEDLPFKKGDVIVLSYKVDDSWGFGYCKGKKGIFPLNYTKKLEEPDKELLINNNKQESTCEVTATMSLIAQIEGELSFEVGDRITISKIMPDDWAFGYIGERSGTFPLSFTSYELSSKSVAPPSKLQGNKRYSSDHHTCLKDIKDNGSHPLTSITSAAKPLDSNCSNFFSIPNDPQLISAVHDRTFTQSKSSVDSSFSAGSFFKTQSSFKTSAGLDSGYNSNDLKEHQKENHSGDKTHKKHFVIANYSHFGRGSDELSFKEGDVIEVLGYKSNMWLHGKLHDSTGLVPQNFVSDYVYSENGHSEISNDLLLSKFNSIQEQSASSQRKSHAKKALIHGIRNLADVRLVTQDFKALTDFELSLNMGDTVHVMNRINSEWCEVKNSDGQVGFVPNSCLQQVKTISKRNSSTQPPMPSDLVKLKNESFKPASNSIKHNTGNESKSVINRSISDTSVSSKNISHSPSTSGRNSDASSINSSNSTGVASRRHSQHSRKVSIDRKKVSKSQSMRVRTRNNVADPRDPSPRQHLSSKPDLKSFSPRRHLVAANESDSVSVTSRESMHSSTLPSSSCSSTCSETMIKQTTPSSSEQVVKESINRKASRSAPPPPFQPVGHVGPDQSNDFEKYDSECIEVRSTPSRPPQPTAKINLNVSIGSGERKLSRSEQKLRIEKIRLEIEEYSRMQKNLETEYNNTYDGKIRQELSEEKQMVVSKLKRLRMELHNLICEVIGDSPERKVQSHSDDNYVSTPPPPPSVDLPPPPSLAEIREKRLVKRSHVIRELIKTEEDYLQDVVITINDIMKPLLERELPLEFKLETIFGNIEEIRDCSRMLLTSFKKAEADQPDPTKLSINVGRILIDNSPGMKEAYKIYCRNHDDATTLLEKYEDDPEFQVPVQEYLDHVKSKINAFDLGSFLIKPVQRILKYPLLLQELLKLTDVPQPGDPREEYDELIKSVKLIQEMANDINEDKRKKDLVRKYRKVDDTFTEKLSRFSLHSVRKKSARISLRLSHVTGLKQPETVDEKFNYLEQRFKNLEKTIKTFLHNVDVFGSRSRDLLNTERILAEYVYELYSSDRVPLVESYIAAMRRTAEHLYRQFHTQTQLRVHTPLFSLLQQFKGPQALIVKRLHKLLDYENCLKSSDSKEKTQMAKNVYEALNQQLVDELPSLCDLSCKLLDACIALYLHFQIKFQRNLLQVAGPVLKLCRKPVKVEDLDKKRIMEEFNAVRNQALVDMRRFTIVPSSFTATTSANKSRSSSSTGGSVFYHRTQSSVQQRDSQRESLLQQYKPEDLYVATTAFSSSDKISLSCSSGDFIAAIKRQNPLGDVNTWFCDDGKSKGFLPATILKSYSSRPGFSSPLALSAIENSSPAKSPEHNRIEPISAGTSFSTSPTISDPSFSGHSTHKNANSEILEATSSTRNQFRLDYAFAARSTLELSVKEGEIVDLIEESDMDGNREWWLVSNSEGKQGYVPANYMSIVQYV